MTEVKILNKPSLGEASEGQSPKADGQILVTSLKKILTELKSTFITEQGNVCYKEMSRSDQFKNYLELARGLAKIDWSTLAEENVRKSFFINLYNCQMIHALIALEELPESPLKVQGMWSSYGYNIGGLNFTLDDIEHGILRCNRGHPSKNQPTFDDEGDPRKDLALKLFDPRIHFALNCGALSCPPIRVYSSEKLDQQLEIAANSFLIQDIEILDGTKVRLSKLLLWYKNDFGSTDDEVLERLVTMVRDESLKSNLRSIIDRQDMSEKIVYRDYNWKVNSQ